VGAVSEQEAQAISGQLDYLLLRLKQRLIDLPHNVGIVDFIQHDSKPPSSELAIPDRQTLTLAVFRDQYLETHRASLESRTLEGIEGHFKPLVSALGVAFPIRELKLADFQGYVNKRAKAGSVTA
jgi:hypothetical protein